MHTCIRPVALALLLAACADGSGGADRAADTTGAVTPAPDAAAPAASASSVAMLDPNAATRDQLLQVPGMTAAAADALIAGRPYEDMRGADRAIASLGDAARDSVYARVWKPIDLNSATAEEIELIPGVGPRMRHEFEEYRPYTSMAQFRREIGKYVDGAEVTRLESYVTIK